jgi:hypothetical protein
MNSVGYAGWDQRGRGLQRFTEHGAVGTMPLRGLAVLLLGGIVYASRW